MDGAETVFFDQLLNFALKSNATDMSQRWTVLQQYLNVTLQFIHDVYDKRPLW